MANKKFSVDCEMEERWVPHFLAVLLYVSHLGDVVCVLVPEVYYIDCIYRS